MPESSSQTAVAQQPRLPTFHSAPAPALLRVQIVFRPQRVPLESAPSGFGGRLNLSREARHAEAESSSASVGKSIPGFELHADFTLTSRHTVLFGPSGSGKSTLLRLLAGVLQPAAGTIVRDGVTLTDTASRLSMPPGQRGIGYLTQQPALFPHLSVESNIGYGLHHLARPARRARIDAMIGVFSLGPLRHRVPLGLSGGESQRVSLARALAPGPSLLLLDEPFVALDTPLREKTVSALAAYLADRPTTILAVSHDVAEVYAGAAEVLLLEGGRIVAQGPSRQVLAPHRERLLRQLHALPCGSAEPPAGP